MEKDLFDHFLQVSLLGRNYNLDKGIAGKELIRILLMVNLFGKKYNTGIDDNTKIELAIDRAYLDFCRTIRKENGQDIIVLRSIKNKAIEDIKKGINKILTEGKEYDKWFYPLCTKITKYGYTFGQAQKWVNMTMKYLLVLDCHIGLGSVALLENKLHAPIDNDIIKVAINKELISGNEVHKYKSWSSKDFKKVDYKTLQKRIKSFAERQRKSRIEWEFQAWNESDK